MKEWDLLILGAGFAGAASAYHLSQSPGLRILVLERERQAGRHASGRNAGLLRQAVECEDAARLIQETLAALQNPPADWPRPRVFRPGGSVLLGEFARLEKLREILARVGGEARLFRREEVDSASFPVDAGTLESAEFEALLFSPEDGVVDALGYLENLLAAAERRGAELRCGLEATELRRENDGWSVLADGEKFRARAVLNAAGAWADELAAISRIPRRGLQPKRRHLFASKKISPRPAEGAYLWDLRHECYFRREGEGLLLCAGDETEHPASNPSVDPQVTEGLYQKLRHFFPAWEGVEVETAWACLRTFGPEGRFLEPADPELPGLFWAAGLGGHGLGLSLGLGRKVAEAVRTFLVGSQGESL